ncbi:P1 family peptidase [Kineococcus sp. SYSU DK004]|uniref:P1 family peptidase n=1 Tax=Kineococcus sp. SYSU DK004 TaxID=3383125 RepID=UPI003D7EFBB3
MDVTPGGGGLTDVAGVRVGHATRRAGGWATGVTVVLPPPGTVAGVDVRGGGPGTHETDALDPRTLVPTADAVVLTGGSAFGLVAAHGVQRWLEERGRGFRVGPGERDVVPVVPAAAVFDLGRGGDPRARPTEAMGYEAAEAAGSGGGLVERGSVGAGAGALVARRWAGGVGTSSAVVAGAGAGGEPVVVGALAVVNAAGAPVAPGAPAAPGVGVVGGEPGGTGTAGLNTTLVVVAVDAVLDPAETSRTATAAHAGLARALDPVHTLWDGDTVFALATQERRLPVDRERRVVSLVAVQSAAAGVVREAVLDAVVSASPLVVGGRVFGVWPG